jgi:hypothetical protein
MLLSKTKHLSTILSIGLFCLVSAFSLLCALASNALAADKKSAEERAVAFIKSIVKGENYLGGKRPGLAGIEPRGQFEYDYQNRKYVRRVKVLVRRAGGDENGRQVLYNSRTYGTALKQLTGWQPSLRMEWAMRLGIFGYAKKFHPIMLDFFYSTTLRKADGTYIASNYDPVRRKKTKKSFMEDLPWALAPGEYQLALNSEVSLADHPVKDLMEIWDWFDFAYKVAKVELPSLFDISKDILKFVIINHVTRTESRYRMVIKAKVPKLIGMTVREAVYELEKWNLRASAADTVKCRASQYGKIIKQGPAPGKLLDPRKPVAVKVCARRPVALPTPTAAPQQIYLFKITNCANSLYIGTEAAVKAEFKGGIEGCGMDWSTHVTYQKADGPFSSAAAAGAALCSGITYWYHNKVVPWGPYAVYKGATCPAFEPSVESYVLNCKYTIVK